MPKRLTESQVEQYQRDGFVAPIDVMSAAQADDFRKRLEVLERQHPEHLSATNRNNLHLLFDCFDEIVHHEAILDAVEDVLGGDILLWGSVLFAKEPDKKSFVSWHQDLRYVTLDPPDGVTAWLALTPSNAETGCMRMIPGSHLSEMQHHEDEFGEDNILTRGQTIHSVDEKLAVDLILEPGQLSLHHGRTIHCSAPNRSDQRRLGLAIQQYIPPHVREPGRGFAQLARGVDRIGHFELIPRLSDEFSEDAQARFANVNAHWAEMLYAGATEKRAY
ncbi:MAG: phytanoyl-CoA dioxygenase [Thiotrichales bacterium]|nr:phytanoyl-CoA dioxygenase [Thiotrichales bacterium]|tara:strand:+ start:1114 stop:1941 length:828 start_codon:yes stop_codon:yes gene_type:complete